MFHDPHCHEMLLGALALAATGLAVFPAAYRTKWPATDRGFYDATTNPATIKRWFGGNFKRNLAVRTGLASGATWVLDVDDPESLEALENRYGPLPATRRSQSSRGAHLWFKTAGVPIPSSAGRVAPGLDIKGELGYVIVPASIHPTGCAYRWLNDTAIAEAPEWLVALAKMPLPRRLTSQPPASPRAFSVASGAYGAAALRTEIETLANTAPGAATINSTGRASVCTSWQPVESSTQPKLNASCLRLPRRMVWWPTMACARP